MRNIEDFIKQSALNQGFVACGIAKAEALEEERERFESYLKADGQAKMSYLERNLDKRINPQLLMEGAKSLIVVLYNYNIYTAYTDESIAKFARLDDYHQVIKNKLHAIRQDILNVLPETKMRAFVDTAPLLEKAWAIKAGLGWRGKNSLLINPEYGSYCNIGILLTDMDLKPDTPVPEQCGNCTLCIEACPSGALIKPFYVDAKRCISYQTIEQKEPDAGVDLHGWTYGCDSCQDVCPWNRSR